MHWKGALVPTYSSRGGLFTAVKVVVTRLLIYRQKVVIYMIVPVRTCGISRAYTVFSRFRPFRGRLGVVNLTVRVQLYRAYKGGEYN